MASRATFIDSIVTKPLVGPCFHFESTSGDEVLHFCMERATAVRVATDILREVERAERACVLPFKNTV
jgi:hypothetical protein